jgi:hypothetical protein
VAVTFADIRVEVALGPLGSTTARSLDDWKRYPATYLIIMGQATAG